MDTTGYLSVCLSVSELLKHSEASSSMICFLQVVTKEFWPRARKVDTERGRSVAPGPRWNDEVVFKEMCFLRVLRARADLNGCRAVFIGPVAGRILVWRACAS